MYMHDEHQTITMPCMHRSVRGGAWPRREAPVAHPRGYPRACAQRAPSADPPIINARQSGPGCGSVYAPTQVHVPSYARRPLRETQLDSAAR